MAAIVSQFAAGNRRKKKEGLCEISNDKSVYFLPPFDPCFDPVKHNAYIRSITASQIKKKNKNNISGAFFLEPRREFNPVISPARDGDELSLAEFLRLEGGGGGDDLEEQEEDDEVSEEDPVVVITQVDMELRELSEFMESSAYKEPCCFLFAPSHFEILRRLVIAVVCLFSLCPFVVFSVYLLMRIFAVD